MNLRKPAAIVPVIVALTLSGPVAGASAATTSFDPGASIPCYPFPAWCGPGGKPWVPWPFPFPYPFPPGVLGSHFAPPTVP
jgi:hypothetical protein